jgi:hypothetical protein
MHFLFLSCMFYIYIYVCVCVCVCVCARARVCACVCVCKTQDSYSFVIGTDLLVYLDDDICAVQASLFDFIIWQ